MGGPAEFGSGRKVLAEKKKPKFSKATQATQSCLIHNKKKKTVEEEVVNGKERRKPRLYFNSESKLVRIVDCLFAFQDENPEERKNK